MTVEGLKLLPNNMDIIIPGVAVINCQKSVVLGTHVGNIAMIFLFSNFLVATCFLHANFHASVTLVFLFGFS